MVDFRCKPFKYRVVLQTFDGNKCLMYSKESKLSLIRKRIEELSKYKKLISIEVNIGEDKECWQSSKLEKEFLCGK